MRVYQFRELRKDFHYLIGTFTTGSNNYDVRFSLLGDCMLQDCLTGTERSRDKSRTTFYNRVHCIDNTHTRFQQTIWTRFFLIIRHRLLHRPFLNHVYRNFLAVLIYQYGHSIFDGIITLSHNRLHLAGSLQLERSHDLQRLVIFLHLTQPSGSDDLVSGLCQWCEVPFLFFIQRISILTSFQENTLHLVEVVLQTVIILRKHTRSQCHFRHVSGKLSLCTHLQSTCAFKNLYIYILAYHLDYLSHQPVTSGKNVAYFILSYRSIHGQRYHVGNNSQYSSFCCHSYLLFYHFLNSSGI